MRVRPHHHVRAFKLNVTQAQVRRLDRLADIDSGHSCIKASVHDSALQFAQNSARFGKRTVKMSTSISYHRDIEPALAKPGIAQLGLRLASKVHRFSEDSVT